MQGLCLEQIRDGMDLEMIDNDDTFIDQLEIYLSPESSNEPLMGDVPRETRCDSPWSMFTCPQEVLSTVSHSLDFHESSERKDDSLPTKIGGKWRPFIQTPRYYAQHITNALNSHDYNYLYHCLRRLSTSDLEITKHVYSYDVTGKGLEERIFGSVEEFCQFMEVWNMFLPDGVFETSSHRQCAADSSTFVFISTLYFSGQKIVKGVDVLNEDLCLYYPRLHEIMVNTIDGRKYPDIVELSGSLVIYVNGFGLVDKMEIFCCQIEA